MLAWANSKMNVIRIKLQKIHNFCCPKLQFFFCLNEIYVATFKINENMTNQYANPMTFT